MKYCIYHSSYPVVFSSCGNLVSDNGFIHPKRNIDSFVLLLIRKGTLYITQDEDEYILHDNEFLILFPHILHYGTRRSDGYLSYYWTHFYISDPSYQITDIFHYEDSLPEYSAGSAGTCSFAGNRNRIIGRTFPAFISAVNGYSLS